MLISLHDGRQLILKGGIFADRDGVEHKQDMIRNWD